MFLFAQTAGTELQDYEKWTAEVQLQISRASALLNGYVLEGAGENLVASTADYKNFMAPPPELAERKLRAELGAVTRLLVRKGWPIRIHATTTPRSP